MEELDMKHGMINSTKSWRLFGGLFLSMLLVFTMASAETEDPSAGAIASADGDVAIASTHVVVTENSASAGATARASASNGGTATAIAEAWANFLDAAMAYALSTSTVTAGIGEIAWAEAYVEVSASADGEAYARADSTICTGENCLDEKDPNSNDNIGSSGVHSSTSGGAVYTFGKSDIERYCHFKLQLSDEDDKNDERAKYFIGIIAWDNGFSNDKTFEQKYNVECTTKQLNMEDNY
jgi:hypothetical protein